MDDADALRDDIRDALAHVRGATAHGLPVPWGDVEAILTRHLPGGVPCDESESPSPTNPATCEAAYNASRKQGA